MGKSVLSSLSSKVFVSEPTILQNRKALGDKDSQTLVTLEMETKPINFMPIAGCWEKVDDEWRNRDGTEFIPIQFSDIRRKEIEAKYQEKYKYGTQKIRSTSFEYPFSYYHSQAELEEELLQLVSEFSNLASLYTIGETHAGNKILVLRLGELVDGRRPLLVPQVKLIGNIHGDEVVGRELLLVLARFILEESKNNEEVRRLLKSLEIHILPSLNPDGYSLKTRNNKNDLDLNRGFPDWANLGQEFETLSNCREPEVKAVMDWMRKNDFILSASFHDGCSMIIHPWDDSPACTPDHNAACSEDETFQELSQIYAFNHSFMFKGKCPCHNEWFVLGDYKFENTETVHNGMQDYNYLFTNCMELTIELSCEKTPPVYSLPTHWNNNSKSILAFLAAANSGVKGLVVDIEGVPVLDARVRIKGIDKEIITSHTGEYWRILIPGEYLIKAKKETKVGILESEWIKVLVKKELGEGSVRIRDIEIQRRELKNKENQKFWFVAYNAKVVVQEDQVSVFQQEIWGENGVYSPRKMHEEIKFARRLKSFMEERISGRNILSTGWNIQILT
ncbi:carboxypeptidase E isoform X2 [Eurytemora carolleeae]|uniref:carboxypeptidase E isoform X2 n=1 Tax=Eurytemora carolleeae TaxID=1294199 RepID=UPI000C78929E|nr:carboxypeptidase E isoform X2 [Eurytemora carolleeae]|eukprot:XP_023333834.1 carboxypeptidase E-like isoform X2 [Eurytemora affinis]